MAKKPTTKSDSADSTSLLPAAAPSTVVARKKARLIDMLCQPDGSTISAISTALGWQAHTTRAAITGLRKAGHAVETVKPSDGSIGLIYRVAPKPDEQAGEARGVEAAR
ncbi:DUF3489 domain-containing protein [Tabrizicola sp.]|uniref:DUF3489 domain-containing protein n=1 Tax=Tabrizicola sp. TaxID=2005166 RepID=UPI003F3B0174